MKDVSQIVQEAGTLCSDISVDPTANPLLAGRSIGLPSEVAPTCSTAGYGLGGDEKPPKRAKLTPSSIPPLPVKAQFSDDGYMDEVEVKDNDEEGDDVSLADGSVSSMSMSSNDLLDFEDELLGKQAVAFGTLLVSGKGNTTKVHLSSPTDDESADPMWLSAWCGSKLHRGSAYQEVARHFNLHQRKPCPKCSPDYPPELEALLW